MGALRRILLALLGGGLLACAGAGGELDAGAAEREDAGPRQPMDAGGALGDAGAPIDGALADAYVPEPEDPPEPEEPPTPEEPDPVEPDVRIGDFRALHWNIAGGKENDCQTPGITRAVLRYVQEVEGGVDFVGLNEVCPAQYTSIRDALARRWGKTSADTFSAYARGGRTGNAIFSRRNLRAINRIEIGEDQYGLRFLLCGRQEGRRVRVCSTHLSPAGDRARRQLGRVLTQIESWWMDRQDTVILAGDFNLEPNNDAFNAIYSSTANHPTNNPSNRGDYHEWDDDDGARCPGYGERSVPRTGGGPCRVGRRIDLIFVRANRVVDRRYAADALNIPTDCTGVCSDHRAVRGRARLRFRVD